jgi:hypothetical protein
LKIFLSVIFFTQIDNNFEKLAKEFEGYRDAAISSGQGALGLIFKDIEEVFKKAATEYLATRAVIVTCVETA